MDDQELLTRCANGEEAAWREFHDHYTPFLYRVIFARLRRYGYREDAETVTEDILADIFHELLKNNCHAMKTFRGESPVRNWLAVLAYRKISQYLKKQVKPVMEVKLSDSLLTEIAGESVSEGEERTFRDETLQLLSAALEQLPERDGEIIKLYFARGLSHEGIAKWSDLSPSGVRKVILRSLDTMREFLKIAQK